MAGTFNLTVSALRWGDDVHATVQATFPAGRHEAQVVDIYPGGTIVYRDDPGEAQIFIRITRTGDAGAARTWEGSREIPHFRVHHDLAVIAEYEGRTFVARTKIHRFRPARETPPAAADPAAIRRAAGLPPAASVAMATPAERLAPTASAPVRLSNSPAPAPL